MVVGSSIDRNMIIRFSGSVDRLRRYSDSLVPSCLRHITELLYNQRYYVAIELRNIKSIEFRKRNKIANELVQDIYISGTFDEIVFIEDIFAYADMDKVFRYLFKEELSHDRS